MTATDPKATTRTQRLWDKFIAIYDEAETKGGVYELKGRGPNGTRYTVQVNRAQGNINIAVDGAVTFDEDGCPDLGDDFDICFGDEPWRYSDEEMRESIGVGYDDLLQMEWKVDGWDDSDPPTRDH